MSDEQLSNLIQMLNQISANNLHHPTEEAASEIIANHLRMYWARSMKQMIIDYAEADGRDLSSLSRHAVATLRPAGSS